MRALRGGLLACLVAGVLAPPLAGAGDAAGGPDGVEVWNVLPAGQGSNVNAEQGARHLFAGEDPPHWTDQLGMYAGLLTEYRGLDDDALGDYFKPAALLPEEIVSTEEPRPGVRIHRDAFGVPHVHGDTDLDVIWGAGYVTGADRMFPADIYRHLGRGRLTELLGANDSNLELDEQVARVAGYSEEELQEQVDALPELHGELGRESLQWLEAFTEGMNAWMDEARADPDKLPMEYALLQLPLEPWQVTDSVAVSVLTISIFTVGGGAELANAALLQALHQRFPDDPGRAQQLYRDLLVRDDPDHPATVQEAFPYLAPPGSDDHDPAATALPDPGSVEHRRTVRRLQDGGGSEPQAGPGVARQHGHGLPDPAAALLAWWSEELAKLHSSRPRLGSNWLGVDGSRTATGAPIAVHGPQAGYFSPQVFLELALHGPSVSARGVAFPGISFAVLIGRSTDYAWSATAGASDIVDLRVAPLCEPDGSAATHESRHYRFDGECLPMHARTDRWFAKPSAGSQEESGLPAPPTVVTAEILRTVHGPVIAFATVDGEPVAISQQRTTFGREMEQTPAVVGLNTNAARDAEALFAILEMITGPSNWLYVNRDEVVFGKTGRYPVRAPGVNPELPTWGTGEWEWQGWLPTSAHPHAVLDGTGQDYLLNWNNKPAPGWHAADGAYQFGPVHRAQSVDEAMRALLDRRPTVTAADLVEVIMDAATTDLRGAQVLPWALRLLEGREDVAAYTGVLADWVDAGAQRVDWDQDGHYDHEAAIALLDAWYEPMVRAAFDPHLGGLYEHVPLPLGSPPSSMFGSGWFGHLQKALRQALGEPVGRPLQVLACADGTAAGCAGALEASLRAAVAGLAESYGDDPASWRAPKERDELRFQATGVVGVDPIDWQNRGTFHQVAHFAGAAAPAAADPPPATDLPATGGPWPVFALGVLMVGVAYSSWPRAPGSGVEGDSRALRPAARPRS